ncbi:lipopolysaccharide biosynthesis protein [[Clostridium] fimetarium]|uniref:Membrane protein involved in the export of O-antigen and teichoic acid n=1 Tax=[Clostridium] fimetarium TaxID=99656 RepID=A0A1I0RLN8_9FIRM|nr:oligosaccharide flippase family protein [[Clostridium] fimetarium]SEW42074.1 Membrane protein involved in the export of O-antigen and teichoic acid [[Clostridium] fimetarium]
MKSKDYAKVGTYYIFGNFFNKGIAFLTIPIFTRILSTYDYGIINTYSSWVSIMSMILGLALHMGIRAAYIDYKDNIKEFVSSIVFLDIIFSSLISLIILVSSYLFLDINMTFVSLCLLNSFFAAIMEDYSMYLMMEYRYKVRTTLMILPNLLSIIISMILLMNIQSNDKYMERIVPMAVICIIFGFGILVIILVNGKCFIKLEYWKFALKVSVPLIFHGISLSILSQSDRIMITSIVGADQAGIYSLVYNLSVITLVLGASLEGIWIPWFMINMKSNNIEIINKKVIDYVNIMTYAMIILLLISDDLLKILAPQKYWSGIIIIPILILSSYIIFIYTLYVNIEHYYKKTVYIAINTLIAAVSNIILNFIFIPKFGFYAAAFTTLFSYILSFILHLIYAKKLERDLFPLKILVKPLLLISVTILIFYIFIDYAFIRWILLILFLVFLTIKEKKRLIGLMKH